MFAALADPTRRDIVARLAAGDATVGELTAPYDMRCRGLQVREGVRRCGPGHQRKDGQRRPCHLEAEVLDLTTKWLERYRLEAERRYQRLDAVQADMQDGERPTRRPR
nr:ArsR family transcriptional regulator [Rhabdothermincola sediminis]